MPELYTNQLTTSSGFKVGSQTSIDDRILFEHENAVAEVGSIALRAARYYKGLYIRTLNNNKEYVWTESSTGLLHTINGQGYTYGAYLPSIYANKTYDFVEVIPTATGVFSKVKGTFVILQAITNLPNFNFTITSSPPAQYKYTGDLGITIGTSQNDFESNNIEIFLNGGLLNKLDLGIVDKDFKQVIWVNAYTFKLTIPIITTNNLSGPFDLMQNLDFGDIIQITKTE